MTEALATPTRRSAGAQQKTDWFAVITELQRAGIPMARIGQALGGVHITHTMLVHYRAGTEPLHWRGQKLLEFWCEVTGRRYGDRPMMDVIHGRRVNSSTGWPKDVPAPDIAHIKALRPDGAQPAGQVVAKRRPGRPRRDPFDAAPVESFDGKSAATKHAPARVADGRGRRKFLADYESDYE